jgi:hypothetical protein
MIDSMNTRRTVTIPVLWLLLAGCAVLLGVITIVAVRSLPAQPGAAAEIIGPWAAAAETGDTATMLSLMADDPLLQMTWREVWAGYRRQFQIVPGYAISGVEQRGDTTVATVHFKSNDAWFTAFCVPVEVVEGNIVITRTGTQCGFPVPSVTP